MKTLAIALLATAAMSLPAFAQNAPTNSEPQSQQSQSQPMKPQAQTPQASSQASQQQNTQNQQAAQNNNSMQQQTAQNQAIKPKELSKNDVRQIQTKLNKDGFSSGHVDGVWGPDTRTAVRDFQKSKGIQANGKINQKTVADLGMNWQQLAQQTNNGQGSGNR